MAALTTLNITEKNANNSLSVTVKVNVTKEGVFTTTLSKEDVDKIHSYGIKLPTNRLGNEGYFNSIALSDLESQIREVLKRCLSYKIVEEVPVIKYQLETNCMFSYEYRDHQDFMEFLRNVAADIWVEYTEPEQRSKLFNLMNKKNENSF